MPADRTDTYASDPSRFDTTPKWSQTSNEDLLKASLGIKVWSFNPHLTQGNDQTGTGHVRGSGVYITGGTTINTISQYVRVAGASMTDGQYGIANYDITHNQVVLLASTANTPAAFQATGWIALNLSSPWTCQASGLYYLVDLLSGTTMPTRQAALGVGNNFANGQIGPNNIWMDWYASYTGGIPSTIPQANLVPTGDCILTIGY